MTRLEATFEIQSLVGTVTGTKNLVSPFGFLGRGCPDALISMMVPGTLSYTAQINAPDGTFLDRGTLEFLMSTVAPGSTFPISFLSQMFRSELLVPLPLMTATPVATATRTLTPTQQPSATPAATRTSTATVGGQAALCHATGSTRNPYVFIRVNANAADTHIAHGDFRANSSAECRR